MGVVLRYIVDDIATDLKQIYDDKQIQKAKIAYWVLMIGNRLKSQHIEKRDSGAFLHVFTNVPVVVEQSSTNPNIVKGRKHIVLPTTIYDYNQDRGIEYISYWIDDEAFDDCPPEFTNKTFTRTTPKVSHRLYYDEDERPSPSNPYFYRTGDRVYFLGIEKVNVEEVEIGIYSAFDPLTEIDLDDEFDFPDELVAVLKRQVLDLGRFVLQVPEERKNDGENDVAQNAVPTQKIVSVNDAVNKTE